MASSRLSAFTTGPRTDTAGAPGALALFAALLLGACATTAREPWVLTAAAVQEAPLRDLERISTYSQAFATALDVMQRDLALPTLQVRLIFLPGAKDLETLLLGTGNPPTLARTSARQLTAIGGHRVVLINQARLERGGWPSRISILAHELAHVLQYELGDGTRGNSAQWLREGFAEWLAARVMARLKREGGEKARQRAIIRMRIHAQSRFPMTPGPGRLSHLRDSSRARVPPLGALGSFPDWLEQSRGEAGAILPDYAFIAVDCLIDQHGLPSAMRYFELFRARQDAAANFLEAFGENEEQFEKRLHGIVWR